MQNNVSIGVFAYNEENNIAKLLNSLLNQKLKKVKINEIIVVSSGSTDRTNEIVKKISKKNRKIKLIIEKERRGKASAINLFLQKAKNKVVVIESGDTIPEENCIENLCLPLFENEKLGMTGARAIPTNPKTTFLGRIIHYWWWISNELPRFGEMIAFKKFLCPKLSEKTAVDEAYIEAEVSKKGFKKKQVSNAIVYNHGAETFKDLIKQRKRIYIGHKLLEKEKNYSVQSFNITRIFKLTLRYIFKENSIKTIFALFIGAIIEVYSRIKGFYEIYFKKENPYVWEIAKTTKKVN